LEERQLSRIKNRCNSVTSISLISNQFKLEEMINDSDLLRLRAFARISRLSLREPFPTQVAATWATQA
jgi:hypothetical protein